MSFSLLCELIFGSSVSGAARRTWTVKRDRPRSQDRRQRILVLRDDDDRRRSGGHPRVLIGSRLRSSRDHQPDMHPVAVHAVGVEGPVDLRSQLLAGHSDVERDRRSTLEETIEMLFQEGRMTVCNPQSLPDPVSQDESRVEDAYDRLFALEELPVDGDEDLAVARIVCMIVGPVRGGHPTIIAGEAPRGLGHSPESVV